jgi:ubiquinone biosynthesis protein
MKPPGSAATVAAAPRRTRSERQRQIVAVFTRHGFGLLVRRSPVPVPGRSRMAGGPESLRAALEELGPTFIKLGQILSTRPDLLPDDYIQALSSLQDQLRPIDITELRDVIRQELGAFPEELYGWFDCNAFATASIGQVHLARLKSGENVVVKVQKPSIDNDIELDLAILNNLARIAVKRLDSPLVQNIDEVVTRFSDTLRDELDYVREGHNAERFAHQLGNKAGVKAPRIYWALTTKRVLTMERINGVKITDLRAISIIDVDRKRLAPDLANLIVRQIFDFGFFHADPHPGNFFIQPNGTIGVIDFGMVGTLDEGTRRALVLLLAAWVQGDIDGLVDGLFRLGVVQGGSHNGALHADLRWVLGRYHDVQLADIHLGRVMDDVFRLIRRHRMILRGDLALMAKTLVMYEGLGLMLDPEFVLVTEVRHSMYAALRRLLLPRPDAYSAALNLHALLDLSASSPQRAQRLLGQLERGELGVTVQLSQLDPLLHQVGRLINRVVLALLAAALILALTRMLDTVEAHGSPLLVSVFIVALLGTIAICLWVLLSMLRSGHLK